MVGEVPARLMSRFWCLVAFCNESSWQYGVKGI